MAPMIFKFGGIFKEKSGGRANKKCIKNNLKKRWKIAEIIIKKLKK